MAITDDRFIHMYPSQVRLGHKVTGSPDTIAYVDLDSRQFSLDKQFTTLVTQGTTTTHEKDILEKMLAQTSNQVWQAALNEIMLGAATTTGLPSGEAARWGYDGTLASTFYELRITVTGTDLDSGADVTFEVRIWKVQPKQYDPFAQFSAKQVVEQTAQFSVSKATTDLLGAAIVGLRNAASGDYFTVVRLS